MQRMRVARRRARGRALPPSPRPAFVAPLLGAWAAAVVWMTSRLVVPTGAMRRGGSREPCSLLPFLSLPLAFRSRG